MIQRLSNQYNRTGTTGQIQPSLFHTATDMAIESRQPRMDTSQGEY